MPTEVKTKIEDGDKPQVQERQGAGRSGESPVSLPPEPKKVQTRKANSGECQFARLPSALVSSGKKITSGEFRLWATIAIHTRKAPTGGYEGCWPGRERLALMMGICESRVSSLARGLKLKGLLRIKQRGQGKTSLYFLQDPPGKWKKEMEVMTSRAKEDRTRKMVKTWREGTGIPR